LTVIDRCRNSDRAPPTKQAIHEKLIDHRQFIERCGDDTGDGSGKSAKSQKTSTEGDSL
jgi:xylulose-5-phosphate/fructose-6-phosphate phosphoketolase